MANGIDWFRWHHGSVNDPKFGLVAKKADARVGDVIAVWALVLELASANLDRGMCSEIDHETTDFLLGAEEGTTARILSAMESRGLLDQGRVARWETRQPKREREPDLTAAERKRQQRAREAEQNTVTPSHATSHPKTPREEKSREEKEKIEPKVNSTVEAVAPTDAPEPSPPTGAVQVFQYWQQALNHPAAKLDAKRVRAIKARLKDGYTVADLCRAVDGCKLSPHHQGQNDTNTVYDDIELICRDGPRVDNFRKIAERGPPQHGSQLGKAGQVTANNAKAWLERNKNG